MISTLSSIRFRFFSAILLVVLSINLHATQLPQGDKVISLVANSGESLKIGKIKFQNTEDKLTYTINLENSVFNDEFLSMRPFKCIHQPKQMICHLQYPYQKKGYISKDDLMDLEYDLLFLHKSPSEYGINAWNGLFYQLSLTENGLDGELMEVDLNVLAAPPDEGVLRPVTRDMLYEADVDIHMFPKLVIE